MLRRLLLGSALCFGPLALAAATPALAQSASWTWTGPYAGVNIGYGWGTEAYNFQGTFDPAGTQPAYGSYYHDIQGVMGGGQIGYNFQTPSGVVLGVETDFQATDTAFNDSFSGNDGLGNNYTGNVAARLDYLGTVRARIGEPFMNGRLLPYVTGGLAYGRVSTNGTFNCPTCAAGEGGPFSYAAGEVGWVIGAGAEYAVTKRLSAKLEYLYAQFGNETLNTPSGGFGGPGVAVYNAYATQQLDANIIRVGLNYHF
jgi:outer membrane immunogenic protein